MVLIEAAIDSLADAERAVREGADRLEVCGDLDTGGVTPLPELLRACVALGVPCVAMTRFRAGNFVHDGADIIRLCVDAEMARRAGARGVIFGCLRSDGTVDEQAVAKIVRTAGDGDTIFHRAFDETPDAFAALDALIAHGVTRVLTSGHARTALEGADNIAALIARSAGRLTVLPGGTVRGDNVRALVERTGATQVHARATEAGVITRIRAALGR